MSQFLESGGQIIGVSTSASVHPMNIQDWFPLGLTGLIGGEWIHVYVWLSPFASTWNYHKIVNQLYSKVKLKIFLMCLESWRHVYNSQDMEAT